MLCVWDGEFYFFEYMINGLFNIVIYVYVLLFLVVNKEVKVLFFFDW